MSNGCYINESLIKLLIGLVYRFDSIVNNLVEIQDTLEDVNNDLCSNWPCDRIVKAIKKSCTLRRSIYDDISMIQYSLEQLKELDKELPGIAKAEECE